MVISETRLSLSFLFNLFMLTDLMATDWRFSCIHGAVSNESSCLGCARAAAIGATTYNVNAAVDFGEAALANVVQALELADDLL